MSPSLVRFLTPDEVAAQEAHEAAYHSALAESIQSLKDLVGPGIRVTLTNEFGASVNY
jgi:hypothetical protein